MSEDIELDAVYFDTTRFLSEYEQMPELWDTRHKSFKDVQIRTGSMELLGNQLGISDMSTLRRKIRSIRGMYNTEIRKIKQSLENGRDGEVYVPKLAWFPLADRFLRVTTHLSYEEFPLLEYQATSSKKTPAKLLKKLPKVTGLQIIRKRHHKANNETFQESDHDALERYENRYLQERKENGNETENSQESYLLVESLHEQKHSDIQVYEEFECLEDDSEVPVKIKINNESYHELIEQEELGHLDRNELNSNAEIHLEYLNQSDATSNTDRQSQYLDLSDSNSNGHIPLKHFNSNNSNTDEERPKKRRKTDESKCDRENEFLTFGRSIGLQLQTLPLKLAIQLQMDIQAHVSKARLKYLQSDRTLSDNEDEC